MSNVMFLESERPETEVSAKASRRKFTAVYKRRILREAAPAGRLRHPSRPLLGVARAS
jgi:hypothetical protein